MIAAETTTYESLKRNRNDLCNCSPKGCGNMYEFIMNGTYKVNAVTMDVSKYTGKTWSSYATMQLFIESTRHYILRSGTLLRYKLGFGSSKKQKYGNDMTLISLGEVTEDWQTYSDTEV